MFTVFIVVFVPVWCDLAVFGQSCADGSPHSGLSLNHVINSITQNYTNSINYYINILPLIQFLWSFVSVLTKETTVSVKWSMKYEACDVCRKQR